MAPKTVLVIEDNQLNLKLVKGLLTIGKFNTLTAHDAETGIELARKHKPDLILMDIQLPGLDGLSATRMIKSDKNLKHIPVIALTSYAMQGDDQKAKAAGCNGYVTKPIDTRNFIDILKSYLKNNSSQRPAANDSTRPKPTILIVDDEPKNVKLLAARLSRSPFRLEKAYSGREAIKKVQTILPDLILLDVMMPQMDGYEVTRHLKSDSEFSQIPIILVTSLDGKEDKIKGMLAGADEFLTKPVHTLELMARIKSMIRLKQYQEQLSNRRESKSHFSSNTPLPDEPEILRSRILIVEDSDIDLKMIKKNINGVDADIVEANSGEEALQLAQNESIDLILLDIMLPGINGYEVCNRLKSQDQTADIQIVLITCMNDLESRIRGVELGCDDFLIKPVDGRELSARVKVLLKKRECLKKLRSGYHSTVTSNVNDNLTGLYNRAYFRHFLELEMNRSRSRGHSLGVMLIHLDWFDEINQTFGLKVGEQLLVEVANVIKGGIREVDLAARYGGEQFAVIMPYAGNEGITEAARRVHGLISQAPYSLQGSFKQGVTVSIGVALFPMHANTVQQLVEKADEMVRKAQKGGHDRVFFCQG